MKENYIKRLEREVREATDRRIVLMDAVCALRNELTSPKFCGTDTDGGRKDWMATSDIDTRLENLLQLL